MDARWNEIDPYVEAFERARSGGVVADLAAFAPPPRHELYLPVLRELVRVDLEFGWATGSSKTLADYQRLFPALFADGAKGNEIAFEEYRLRCQSGDAPSLHEYRDLDIDVSGWPAIPDRAGMPQANLEMMNPVSLRLQTARSMLSDPEFAESKSAGDNHTSIYVPVGRTVQPISYLRAAKLETTSDVRTQLQKRLQYVGLGCAAILGYFSLLVVFNPQQKVAFSLQSWFLVAFNWIAFVASTILATILWARPMLGLSRLRLIEISLFGIMLAEISLGLFSDLFVDQELREPFTQGEHALFHYGSSWSLPFFALIVCYGTLIPSTWLRCGRIVTVMAIVPLIIVLAAGMWEGIFTTSFVQSLLVQITIWMIAAVSIAVFGTSRIEVLLEAVSQARRLGQYQLKERLGSGGMGEVFLAEHMLLRRPCAIKLIRPEFAGDPSVLRRFEHEVQVTATLTHPNTVQIFDYGHADDGTFYYVMEYLPGLNLEQEIQRNGPMRPARVVHVIRQLCGALREAHAAGLIHRDLKPSNVILCELGGVSDVAKLLDFGLALGHGIGPRPQRLSGEGTITGSPVFMSPEQAAGRENIDTRTDIYSLGAVMYFLLTGKPPFVRETVMQTLAAHMHEAVTSPDCLRSDIPVELQSTILKCLEKDPNQRFQDVAGLEESLRFVIAARS